MNAEPLDLVNLLREREWRALRRQRLIMSLWFLLLFSAVILHTCVTAGCDADAEPSHALVEPQQTEALTEMDQSRQARETARLAEEARDKAIEDVALLQIRRAEKLAAAMEAYIVHLYCEEPVREATERGSRQPQRACRIDARGAAQIAHDRDLLGFSYVLLDGIENRRSTGQWVPFGEELAPAWLASVAYHEFSWHWRNTTRVGRIGERCAFQVAEGAIRHWARSQNALVPLVLSPQALSDAAWTMQEAKRSVSRDPNVCLDVAISWMDLCARQCGGRDVREFLQTDESGEPLRQWRNVRVRYLEDGRFMTTKIVRKHVVVPTEARLWMGAYATPGICGGALDVVRERFETAWWIARQVARSRLGRDEPEEG